MIDWIISLVPWWLYLITALIAVAAVWRLLGWQGALAAAAALIAVLGYGKGRADASRDERSRRDRDVLNHVVIRDRVEDEIDALGAQDVDERLMRWNRAED
jgi:hypothetical protein